MRNFITISIILVSFILTSSGLSSTVVVVKVPEGLVLAADSRTTYKNDKGDYRIATDNAHKVFRLGKTCGCVSYGGAFIEGKNVSSLIQQFKILNNLNEQSLVPIDKMLTRFKTFFDAKEGNTSFYLLGYDADRRPKIFKYGLSHTDPVEKFPDEITGVSWDGQKEAIFRLLKGYDYRFSSDSIFKVLDAALGQHIDSTSITTLKENIRAAINNELADLACVHNTRRMTVQDGIDFALFLTRTAIDYQRFTDGIVKNPGAVPGSGGPIDLAIITPEGFHWIQKKKLAAQP